jgi:5-methylcytosine-specific restriction endonuclease McrA
MTAKKDYAGLKAYNLTIIKPTDRRDRKSIIWEALCDCGQTTYVVPHTVIYGSVKSCGCLVQPARIQNGLKRRKHDPIKSSALAVWGQRYTDCSFEDFYSLSQKNCYYCGNPPSNSYCVKKKRCSSYQLEHGNFIHNGLDRIDSNLRHTLDNVVPCCKRCNQAKNDMTTEEFFKMIMSIYNLHLSSS